MEYYDQSRPAGFAGLSVAPNPEDEKKQVWAKLQALRNGYMEDMMELYGMLTSQSYQSVLRNRGSVDPLKDVVLPFCINVAGSVISPGLIFLCAFLFKLMMEWLRSHGRTSDADSGGQPLPQADAAHDVEMGLS
ncbi:hypothetical protein KC19_1G202500 [Ceratodon purpureus]|uniref:Uncharacterized protein n=1 Tax=Ceratodon purpureus TaxID=3225 RepID=A0A8T0J7B8_CERPU|nr:hypothetical protein KC19_1G202500 [Ceratodon purpureus]